MYTDADTTTNTLNELSMMDDNYKPDVIMITEVKPKYSTSVARINIDGNHVYTNLESESHRGVAIYIANSIDNQSTTARSVLTHVETLTSAYPRINKSIYWTGPQQ